MEKTGKVVTVPQWLATGILPVLITVGGWVWTASALTGKVNAQEQDIKALYANISLPSDMAKRHDAILPIMQSDIHEIKGDIKKILTAVKQ